MAISLEQFMKLAIVHHHLNRGGVTQVIANHLRALDAVLPEPLEVALIHGGRHDGWSEPAKLGLRRLSIRHVVVPEIDYDEIDYDKIDHDDAEQVSEPDPPRLAEAIGQAIAAHGFPRDETVLHVHNHSLGKNVSLPGAIHLLASQGFRFLLQIHDFAEDFRPANYRRLHRALGGDEATLAVQLYPQAEQIHYGVLNTRDAAILKAAGVDPRRLEFLPNPVVDQVEVPARSEARLQLNQAAGIAAGERLVVYPVRGIRRKNVGEMLLWAALAPAGCRFALTLAPQNPLEQPAYEAWRRLASELQLPCLFGLGEIANLSFTQIIAAADAILTTSVAEGFGMVFLESQLFGKRLIGRDLPEVTADFVDCGLTFPHLSKSLEVPFDLLDRAGVTAGLASAYERLLADYRLSGEVEAVFAHELREFERQLATARTIDFAMLSFDQQSQVIRWAAEDAATADSLRAANPWMTAALEPAGVEPAEASGDATVQRNALLVAQHFGPRLTGERLLSCYRKLLESPAGGIGPLAAPQTILRRFLAAARLRQIRNQPQ